MYKYACFEYDFNKCSVTLYLTLNIQDTKKVICIKVEIPSYPKPKLLHLIWHSGNSVLTQIQCKGTSHHLPYL